MVLPELPYGTPLVGAAAGQWAAAILDGLKAPVNETNVYTLAGWFHLEGGGGTNNPMNTTLGNYPSINSDGVKNYPSPEVGVAETVATLENGYYDQIVAAFRAGTGLESPSAEAAAELGTWSGGGYHAIPLVVVPMPAPPIPPKPKEDVMAVAATVDKDGRVHVFQETADGTVYSCAQTQPGGPYDKPFVVMKNGQKPAA